MKKKTPEHLPPSGMAGPTFIHRDAVRIARIAEWFEQYQPETCRDTATYLRDFARRLNNGAPIPPMKCGSTL